MSNYNNSYKRNIFQKNMSKKLQDMTADNVDLNTIKWINYPNKVWERELILLVLHQKGPTTKLQLIKKGFPQHLAERHLDYLTKKGKVQRNEQTMEYSRTSSKHKFHYNGSCGKLE